eukprot:4693316-Pleurochrysis_carterae.AAC.1
MHTGAARIPTLHAVPLGGTLRGAGLQRSGQTLPGGPSPSQHAALVQHDGPARPTGWRLQPGGFCGKQLCIRRGRLRV